MNTATFVRAVIAATCVAVSETEAQVEPPSLNVYVTLATDYLQRGMSQTSGDPALQLGVDYRHHTGLFVGAWASNVDYMTEQSRARPRDHEIDYYIGFDDRGDYWSWTVTLAHYSYPRISFDYDYTELSVGVSFKNRISYRAAYTDDLLSIGYQSLGQEFGARWPLPRNIELGFTLGHFRTGDIPGGDYVHYNLGLSKLADAFTFDLRYYNTNYSLTTHIGRPADRRWVASFSYGFDAI